MGHCLFQELEEQHVIVGETNGANSAYASVDEHEKVEAYAHEEVEAQVSHAQSKKQDERPHSGLSEGGGGGGGEGTEMTDMTDMRVERVPWARRFEQQGVLDGVLGRVGSEGADRDQRAGGVLFDLDLCSIFGQDGNSIPIAFQMCAGLLAVHCYIVTL